MVRAELLAECEGEREGRERELLTTAHREWSKAQEAVSRAEVEGRVKVRELTHTHTHTDTHTHNTLLLILVHVYSLTHTQTCI